LNLSSLAFKDSDTEKAGNYLGDESKAGNGRIMLGENRPEFVGIGKGDDVLRSNEVLKLYYFVTRKPVSGCTEIVESSMFTE